MMSHDSRQNVSTQGDRKPAKEEGGISNELMGVVMIDGCATMAKKRSEENRGN